MDVKEALEYIHNVSWNVCRPGLERIRGLLERMGNPQKGLKFVHVAGTNGKGSVCAMTESVLRKAGYRTGLFTSPYVERFNERIRVNGEDIPDKDLAELTAFVRSFAEEMAEHPTEFELVTAIGFEYFRRRECDIVVLEVGLGGALDSTNVIEAPILSVITEIDLDHTVILGGTIKEIAAAKAGIIKAGRPVVSADNANEAAAVVSEVCARLGCRRIRPDYGALADRRCGREGISFRYKDFGDLRVSLWGTYQFRNAAATLAALEVLGEEGFSISAEAVKAGFAAVRWPARFQLLRENPPFIFDGGHNPQGVRAACESYTAHFGDEKAVFLTGVMADKDYKTQIRTMLPLALEFVTVSADSPRALSAAVYAEAIRAAGGRATACGTVEEGVRVAIKLSGGKTPVLALGTLHMYGQVVEELGKEFKVRNHGTLT